jgi:hypothetical protein
LQGEGRKPHTALVIGGGIAVTLLERAGQLDTVASVAANPK